MCGTDHILAARAGESRSRHASWNCGHVCFVAPSTLKLFPLIEYRGGLGHFALLWASALGAEVYALSHTGDKEDDAKALGAKSFIDTTEKEWAKSWAFKFDFILNCADKYERPLASSRYCMEKSNFMSLGWTHGICRHTCQPLK